MSDVSIGSVSASILLKTDAFLAAAQMATAAFNNMGTTMEAQATATQAALEASTAAMGAAFVALGVTIADQVIKIGSDMEQMMLHLQANTGSTDAQMREMSATIMQMGQESGASLESIAGGMQHIRNFGYDAAESTKILHAALMASVATGADANATANLLASTMRQFSIGADQATQSMNALMVAAQKGNTDLQGLVGAGQRAFTTAAEMGVSFRDVAAAMSTLTQHGHDANRSATALTDVMLHIVKPTKQAADYIASLGEQGKQLGEDFSGTGLKTRGLSLVLADMAKVAEETGKPLDEVILNLIAGVRGGTTAMALAGIGADDYKQHLTEVQEAIDGKVTPAQQGYNNELAALNTQLGRLKNEGAAAATSFYEAWAPTLTSLAEKAANLVHWLNQLPDADLGRTLPEIERGWDAVERARGNALRPGPNATPLTSGMNPPAVFDPSRLYQGDQVNITVPQRAPGSADELAGFDPTGGLTKKQQQYNDIVMAQYRAQQKALGEVDRARERGQTEATRAAEEAQRTAERTAEAVKSALDRAYAATHNRYDVERRDADRQYLEDMQAAKGNAKAKELIAAGWVATKKRIFQDELKDEEDYMERAFDKIKEDAKKRTEIATKLAAEQMKLIEEITEYEMRMAQESEAAQEKLDNQNIDNAVKMATEMIKAGEQYDHWLTNAITTSEADQMAAADAVKANALKNHKEMMKSWTEFANEARSQFKSILVDALGHAFVNGWKGFFKQLLQAFEQMLAQMAAQALISGIFNLFGGMSFFGAGPGGLLGGSKGGLSLPDPGLGFDNPRNDRMATRWGWDLADYLSRGVDSYNAQRGGMARAVNRYGAATAGGPGGVNVHVNMTGDHYYHSDMDARRVADTIAFHAQNRLQVVRKPKA